MVQYDNATEDTVTGVRVGLPLPIWNRNQGGIRQAQAELRQAAMEFGPRPRQSQTAVRDNLSSVSGRTTNRRVVYQTLAERFHSFGSSRRQPRN